MSLPLATVAFVPREVFSTTRRSLQRLLAVTEQPYELVVVDGGSPPDVADYLVEAARRHGFTLVRCDQMLSPNQARNLALAHVRTKYAAFIDNDVMPSEGWLNALVACAEETGAWVVGPKYFEHEPEGVRLHMYGGECRIDVDDRGQRTYVEVHRHAHRIEADVDEPLERCETDLIEFHTALVALEAFRLLGPLDEGLLCTAEHGDLCMSARSAGGKVYLEPTAEITYIPPRTLTAHDRRFFALRWSEAWQRASVRRLNEKYDLSSRARHNRLSQRWIAGHRRYALGWLWRFRRRFGDGAARRLERWVVGPIESRWNLLRYPPRRYGVPPTPTPRVIHASPALRAA